MASSLDSVQNASDDQLIAELAGRIKRYHDDDLPVIKQRLTEARALLQQQLVAAEIANNNGLSPAAAAEGIVPRPAELPDEDDRGEQLIDTLLKLTGVEKFIGYWELGDLIYGQNPYFAEDAVTVDYSDENIETGTENLQTGEVPVAGILTAGPLEPYNASWDFFAFNPKRMVPKAKDKKPDEVGSWYYRRGRESGQVPERFETPPLKTLMERNVVKELEIAYRPEIFEFDGQGRNIDEDSDRPIDPDTGFVVDPDTNVPIQGVEGTPKKRMSHIVVLYCGMDH